MIGSGQVQELFSTGSVPFQDRLRTDARPVEESFRKVMDRFRAVSGQVLNIFRTGS